MMITIKDITLENFKGVRSATYKFDERNVVVSGQNASGKTTLATAWFFLLGNCDYALKNNPAIFPLDAEECKPTVTANIVIGSKPMRISKTQTRKVGKPDENGVSKVAFSNTFSINDCPVSARDFEARLAEEGVELDKLLALSHPDVFMSEKKDEQRKLLFAMASGVTDYDVATSILECKDVADMLRSYKLDEIVAMHKATLRKINEDYGKEGEILMAKIEGLQLAKVDIDVSDLELKKSALKEQADAEREKIENIDKANEAYSKTQDELMKMKFELGDMQRNATSAHEDLKRNKVNEIGALKNELLNIQAKKQSDELDFKSLSNKVVVINGQLERCREEYITTNKMTIDPSATTCRFCGQELPKDKAENVIAEFENRRASELKRLADKGNTLKAELEQTKSDLEKLEAQMSTYDEASIQAQIDKMIAEYDAIDDTKVSIEDSPEYIELSKKIADAEAKVVSMADVSASRQESKMVIADLESQIHEIDKEIAKSLLNDSIDEQIASLRSKQLEYEQNRADAEKILYEVDLISRRKNEILTDSINSNFKIVKFRFFDYLKNGTYKEVCDVYVDGKKLGESMNTALSLRAKLDICNGLGNFYKQHFPIWLDNAEALDSFNKASVESDSQVIMLCVSEDKEVTVR